MLLKRHKKNQSDCNRTGVSTDGENKFNYQLTARCPDLRIEGKQHNNRT